MDNALTKILRAPRSRNQNLLIGCVCTALAAGGFWHTARGLLTPTGRMVVQEAQVCSSVLDMKELGSIINRSGAVGTEPGVSPECFSMFGEQAQIDQWKATVNQLEIQLKEERPPVGKDRMKVVLAEILGPSSSKLFTLLPSEKEAAQKPAAVAPSNVTVMPVSQSPAAAAKPVGPPPEPVQTYSSLIYSFQVIGIIRDRSDVVALMMRGGKRYIFQRGRIFDINNNLVVGFRGFVKRSTLLLIDEKTGQHREIEISDD